VITLGHILLSGILGLGVLQGLRWFLRNRRVRQKNGRVAPLLTSHGLAGTCRLNSGLSNKLIRTEGLDYPVIHVLGVDPTGE